MSERAHSGPANVAPPALPGPAVGGGTPSAVRRAVLVHLRRHGPSAPDTIAAAIGASRSGVAQQLRALDTAGAGTRPPGPPGVGGAHHPYDATPPPPGPFSTHHHR